MEKFKNNLLEMAEPIKSEEDKSKESIFEGLIMREIVAAFSSELEDCEFEPEERREFEIAISSLDEESIKGVLSMPKELRQRNFPQYLEDIRNGRKTIEEIVRSIADNARKNSFTLGYHVTNNQILPNGTEWLVHGKELDDRDDRTMAYYSLDYTNIYRAHRRKFLYVVRACIGPNTEHKRDTSNNWGRASTLSIVLEIDLADIDEKVEKDLESIKQKKDAA